MVVDSICYFIFNLHYLALTSATLQPAHPTVLLKRVMCVVSLALYINRCLIFSNVGPPRPPHLYSQRQKGRFKKKQRSLLFTTAIVLFSILGSPCFSFSSSSSSLFFFFSSTSLNWHSAPFPRSLSPVFLVYLPGRLASASRRISRPLPPLSHLASPPPQNI